jgi:hypothetical protein
VRLLSELRSQQVCGATSDDHSSQRAIDYARYVVPRGIAHDAIGLDSLIKEYQRRDSLYAITLSGQIVIIDI